jgi:hypothetical protein
MTMLMIKRESVSFSHFHQHSLVAFYFYIKFILRTSFLFTRERGENFNLFWLSLFCCCRRRRCSRVSTHVISRFLFFFYYYYFFQHIQQPRSVCVIVCSVNLRSAKVSILSFFSRSLARSNILMPFTQWEKRKKIFFSSLTGVIRSTRLNRTKFKLFLTDRRELYKSVFSLSFHRSLCDSRVRTPACVVVCGRARRSLSCSLSRGCESERAFVRERKLLVYFGVVM